LNSTPSKIQWAKPAPSIFAISHLEVNSTMARTTIIIMRRKKNVYREYFLGMVD